MGIFQPSWIADDIRDYHSNGSALLLRTRRFKRKNTLSRISNIYYASDAEAAKISNIGSCMPEYSLTLLYSKTVSILAETKLAMLEVVETSSPERQSGVISRYTIAPFMIKEETTLYISIKLPTQVYPVQSQI